jgi:hypothetical protein
MRRSIQLRFPAAAPASCCDKIEQQAPFPIRRITEHSEIPLSLYIRRFCRTKIVAAAAESGRIAPGQKVSVRAANASPQ